MKNGGLALPKGIIAGISIEGFLRVVAEPATGITDFDKLPGPYRAVATNIETGEAVVLSSGNVAEAMRASMAVPGAIAPVSRDGRLLVDGMIANNLPIDSITEVRIPGRYFYFWTTGTLTPPAFRHPALAARRQGLGRA